MSPQNNTFRIKESTSIKHNKSKEENEIVPQGKLKPQDAQFTKSTNSSENNEKESYQKINLKASTSKVIDNQHNSQIINPQDVDKNVQNSKVNNLQLKLDESQKKDIVDTVKIRSSSIPLSPVSEVLKGVVNEGHKCNSTAVVDGGEKTVKENETPAPVAPPRRKRKKKVEAKITTTDNTVEDSKVCCRIL